LGDRSWTWYGAQRPLDAVQLFNERGQRIGWHDNFVDTKH